MKANNVVEWHSQNANTFDNQYNQSTRFMERVTVWSKFIQEFSGTDQFAMDIGCGSGALTFTLAEHNQTVLAVDPSPEMLNLCVQKLSESNKQNITFKESNLGDAVNHIESPANLIACSSVIEYLDDIKEQFTLLHNMLEPGGVLLFSLPNKQSFYRQAEKVIFTLTGKPGYYRYVKNLLSKSEAESILVDVGFKPLKSSYYAGTPLLSTWLRPLGLANRSDNLYLIAAQKL